MLPFGNEATLLLNECGVGHEALALSPQFILSRAGRGRFHESGTHGL